MTCIFSCLLIYLYVSLEDPGSESSASSAPPNIDPDDPMHDYLLEQWREERARKKGKKSKSKRKHKDETPEERRQRKERKRERKARREANKSEGLKGVEALLRSLDQRGDGREEGTGRRDRSRSGSPHRRSREWNDGLTRGEKYRDHHRDDPRRRS
jgi:RNA-binding motif X-linked protein 2